jgi:hypothetical protein
MRREVWASHGVPIQCMPRRADLSKEGGEVAMAEAALERQAASLRQPTATERLEEEVLKHKRSRG